MKYIHTKLGREAKETGSNGHYCISDGRGEDAAMYTPQEIEALGFEPVEETPEWIEKAYETWCNIPSLIDYDKRQHFANSILLHMPK